MRQNTLNITARHISGQKRYRATVSRDLTVGEVLDGLLKSMNLNRLDESGSRIPFEARLEREGRNLRRDEVSERVLRDQDELVLHPRIMAG